MLLLASTLTPHLVAPPDISAVLAPRLARPGFTYDVQAFWPASAPFSPPASLWSPSSCASLSHTFIYVCGELELSPLHPRGPVPYLLRIRSFPLPHPLPLAREPHFLISFLNKK